jgi:putative acetyltransferase
MRVTPCDPGRASSLLATLDRHLEALYSPDERHLLDLASLRLPNVCFAVAEDDHGAPLGCGGFRRMDDYGEIKRMWVDPVRRRLGVGRAILAHLEGRLRQEGFDLARLETAIHQHEAVALYERIGYRRCGAFGEYSESGVSVCMEKRL